MRINILNQAVMEIIKQKKAAMKTGNLFFSKITNLISSLQNQS